MKLFFSILLIALAPLFCLAQETYKEIELYRSLLDKETRDSSYHKALLEYDKIKTLSTHNSSKLKKKLEEITALPENTIDEIGRKTETLLDLAGEAGRKKDFEIELSALNEAFTLAFWEEPRNFRKAFVIGVRLEEKLSKVNNEQLLIYRQAYIKLGEAHYIFKDYAKSIELLDNVIDLSPISFEDCTHLEALRISGICYAYTPNMMERSDSCFTAMMQCPDIAKNRPVYDALALSNLGCNAMLKGEFDKALALDTEVIDRLKEESDYGHIAGMCACQGFSYYGKGDYVKLRMVLDSIRTYAGKDFYNRNKRLKQAYTLSAKYYSAIGDAETAQKYNDSLISLYHLEEEAYTSQFISDAQQIVKDEKIQSNLEEIFKQKQLSSTLLVLVVISLTFMYIIYKQYRRKREAYRALVIQSRQWAQQKEYIDHKTMKSSDEKTISNDAEESLMKHIFKIIVEDKMFKNKALSVSNLSEILDINRTYISNAINRTTGQNFNTFVNEYRVKEAIHIMSKDGINSLSIDQIAEQSGFSNRQSFYEAFKKTTGISPSDFRKNYN